MAPLLSLNGLSFSLRRTDDNFFEGVRGGDFLEIRCKVLRAPPRVFSTVFPLALDSSEAEGNANAVFSGGDNGGPLTGLFVGACEIFFILVAPALEAAAAAFAGRNALF